MMKNFAYFPLFVLFVLSGCAHSVHEVHVSDFLPAKATEGGEMIRAQSEQFVVMGFTDNTRYVDDARKKLISACPQGAVTGITTQYSTSLSFFSWTNKILMQGLCVKN